MYRVSHLRLLPFRSPNQFQHGHQNGVASIPGHRFRVSIVIFISQVSPWSPPKKMTLACWNILFRTNPNDSLRTKLDKRFGLPLSHYSIYICPAKTMLNSFDLREHRDPRGFVLPLVKVSIQHTRLSQRFLVFQRHALRGWNLVHDLYTVSLFSPWRFCFC